MPTKDRFPNRAGAAAYGGERFDTAEEYRDLCSNCDNGDACCGRTRPKRRPIFFCEEFMVFGAEPDLEPNRSVEEKPREVWSTNGHIGLCTNCDNASTCSLPKPEGGVWHCEEYR